MRQSVYHLQQIHQVAYYDFSSDSEVTTYPELFYNSDHLSDCGTRVLTEKLRDVMSANGDLDK
jgi:hypothetical protein